MRKLFSILAVGALAMATAPAQAIPVTAVGAVSISLAGLNPLIVPGSATVNVSTTGVGHITALSIPASPFAAAGIIIPITDPAAAPIKGIQATVHNAAGAFAGATLGGSMSLNGVTKVCLFKVCSNATANLSVPLSNVGVGGTIAVPPGSTTASVNLTVRGAPWTAGTAAVGTVTQMGFQHGPASASSSTVAASGAIRLVSPIFVSTNIGASAVVPGFAFLDLHFVPEPGTLLLLGSGIAGLVMFGRSKRS
jgi:hypothetical protein